jgi:D-ribose pyranose/furanose isomerase RbsD
MLYIISQKKQGKTMNSKETLNKVMTLLGMHKQDEEVVAPEVQEETKEVEATVELAVEDLPLPTPEEEKKDEEVKEEKMAIEDVVAALEARIKSLEDKLAAAEVEVEVPEEEEMGKKKNTMMSSEKKFTGAPVEKIALKADPAFSMKVEGTMARVFQRLNN